MPVIPFVGPTYNLDSRPASVQRTVNMVPVPEEPGNERTGWVFQDVPGLTAVTAAGDFDPFFAFVGYLLHMDNPASPFSFPDVELNVWAREGVAHPGEFFISGSNPKFGDGSLFIQTKDGTSTDYGISASAIGGNYTLSAGNKFTQEGWLYWTGNVDSRPSVGQVISFGGSVFCEIQFETTNQIRFYTNLNIPDTQVVSPPLNQWVHLAQSYDGTTKYWFVNGVLQGSSAVAVGAAKIISGYRCRGTASGNLSAPAAYVDEIRFTFDVCRYTSSFTPPTAPFPDSGP